MATEVSGRSGVSSLGPDLGPGLGPDLGSNLGSDLGSDLGRGPPDFYPLQLRGSPLGDRRAGLALVGRVGGLRREATGLVGPKRHGPRLAGGSFRRRYLRC